jgi:hypothetical protein
MEHYRESIWYNDFEHIFETVRAVGGENIARLHDTDLARLFAAAPQMLDALELAADYVKEAQGEESADYKQVMAAIRAAKGEV